jgi:hypothetical protein
VDDAPVIDRLVYVVYPLACERNPLLEQALGLLVPRQPALTTNRAAEPAL